MTTNMTINKLYERLEEGSLTSVDLVRHYLEKAKRMNKVLNAYTHFDREAYLLEQAYKVDQRREKGEKLSKVAGMPIGIKDNIWTRRMPTTAASRLLQDFYTGENATATEILEQLGAITIGKLNMDEFGMGSSNENSFFGPVINPLHKDYVPGGSSGGSAAAVAADLAIFTLGTDTGGSIRQPSAYCGVVGMKPTYGAISRYGLVNLAASFDQIGAVTKTVEDMAIVMDVLIGRDVKDPTSRDYRPSQSFESMLGKRIEGMKVALPKEYFGEGLSPIARKVVLEAAEVLAKEGAEIEEISMPFTSYLIPIYYGSTCVEAYEDLIQYTGGAITQAELVKKRSEGFGTQVKKRMLLGAYLLKEENRKYYNKIIEGRKFICHEMNELFKQYPLILSPTAPSTAFKFGEKQSPTEMYLSDIYTVGANIAGIPALSLPRDKGEDGMPIGVQLMAGRGQEGTLLKTAYVLEKKA